MVLLWVAKRFVLWYNICILSNEVIFLGISFEEADERFGYDGSLGAAYSQNQTVFRVWSPAAESVRLNLYANDSDPEPRTCHMMTNQNGVWEATVLGDLNGVYYTYTILSEGWERETIDIYARTAGCNGTRGMVFDPALTDPEGWQQSERVKLPHYTDAVIYELHVRDFSADPSVPFRYPGKFLAFTEKGLTNRQGIPAGLDHIASMGVTHIHLLPVYDFATVDEGSDNPQYNWGYDPLNYNIPEGSYSTNPHDGLCRVREFKQMVQAIHERGIGVIMDVVYNHTYYTGDSPFSKTYPHYYYRHNQHGYSNGSGCGNEFASERRMARRYIIDSLCYLAQEYRLDGFRFDLMGLLDTETLNLAAEKLREINPDIILYGEGWTGGSCPLEEYRRAIKWNARSVPQFAMFSDDFRDKTKGSVFDDRSYGYVNGAASGGMAWQMRPVLCGGVYHPQGGRSEHEYWTDSPCQCVNYVEAHDNLTFWDKLTVSMPGAPTETQLSADKLGAAVVLLSQGIPFMQAGQEFLRSKPAPNGGFVHDSYNSPDSVNSLKWELATPHRDVVDYYRGLIAIRRKFPQFRLSTSEEIRQTMHFDDRDDGVMPIRFGEELLLVINPLGHAVEVYAEGEVYADKIRASVEPLYHIDGKYTCAPRSILLVKLAPKPAEAAV